MFFKWSHLSKLFYIKSSLLIRSFICTDKRDSLSFTKGKLVRPIYKMENFLSTRCFAGIRDKRLTPCKVMAVNGY